MDLNLIEKFILISLNSTKGRFVIDSLSLNYGIAGAILLEMSEMNIISVENRKVILINDKLTNNKIIDASIKLIKESNRHKVTRLWINKIGNKSSAFKKIILKDLSHKNIIKIETSEYFFGLIKFYKYFLIDYKLVDDIKQNLKKIVLENQKADLESILLLSLVNGCKLIRSLFKDKKEYKKANKRIKELTQNIEIGNEVSRTLKEIQSAIIIATTSTFVSSSSS